MSYIKVEKYSYSKLETFIKCPFKYYLKYVLKNFIDTSNINTYVGVLIHKIEQRIGEDLKAGRKIDYEALKKDFYEYHIDKRDKFDMDGGIYGVNYIKEKFKKEFYKVDDRGQSFATKMENYANFGIYRLENFMKEHPELEIYGTEMHFEIGFHDVVLTGSIDRVLRNKDTGEFIIEDIKTKDKRFSAEDTVTPLQAVIYSYALKSIAKLEQNPEKFRYDLPILGDRQDAGTKGYIKRGTAKLQSTIDEIHTKFNTPHPCPLCHWCEFKDAKICPYYSLWTPEHKTFDVKNKWVSMEQHPEIMRKFLDEDLAEKAESDGFDF